MKKVYFILSLLFVFTSCSNELIEDTMENKSVESRSLASTGTDIYPNYWGMQNVVQIGNSLQYDVVYQNTSSSYYTCKSLYTMFLYQGVYDGYYAGSEINWEYNSMHGIYLPEAIASQHGFVVREWDANDNSAGYAEGVASGENFSLRRVASNMLLPGKTLSDIEYVLFFICDGLDNRDVFVWDFYAD